MDTPAEPKVWGIDGDIVVYRVGFAADANDDTLEDTLLATRAALQSIIDNSDGEQGIIYLTASGTGNFRFAVASTAYPYKGNRKDASKPRYYDEIRQYMIDEFDAQVQEDQEADDALAIAAVQQGHGIATLDKDLNGVQGWHYNWVKEQRYYVTEDEANRFFYTQLLTGDSTDNIPSLFQRTGKKAMPKIKAPLQDMQDPAEMYAYVKQVYMDAVEEKGMSSDETDVSRWLLQQGQCLWMRREEGQMWEPPSGT